MIQPMEQSQRRFLAWGKGVQRTLDPVPSTLDTWETHPRAIQPGPSRVQVGLREPAATDQIVTSANKRYCDRRRNVPHEKPQR